MLSDMIDSGTLKGRGLVGFWRAQSDGDDIHLYNHSERVGVDTRPVATFHGLRQQVRKPFSARVNVDFQGDVS